jgi:fibrillarin-like rRNA methylase
MINITKEAQVIFKKEIAKEENKNFKLRLQQ